MLLKIHGKAGMNLIVLIKYFIALNVVWRELWISMM